MRTLALCTAFVMSAATAAYADPPRTYDRDRDHASDRDRDRDHAADVVSDHYDRYDQSRWSRDFHGRWVAIAQGRAASGRHEYWLGAGNRYRKLRIEGVRGEPQITKVAIIFANGSTQVANMNASLTSGTGEVIDLAGDVRRVSRVVVYANPQSRGTYTVFGA